MRLAAGPSRIAAGHRPAPRHRHWIVTGIDRKSRACYLLGTFMSAQHNLPSVRAALNRLALAGAALEKMEQCDGCRRVFPLRQVELNGAELLCADCSRSELATALHPFLPPHPPLPRFRPHAGR